MPEQTTIGITGATGQLGQGVIRALRERGVSANRIVALVRDPDRSRAAFPDIEARVFDYDRPDALASALEGVDRLLLISASVPGRRAEQHGAVIDAAVAAGVGSIFYTSVEAGEAGPAGSVNPVSPEHADTEERLAASGLDIVLLRNGWYTEMFLPRAEPAAATGTLVSSAAEGRVASAARQDYAEAAAAALLLPDPAPVYRLTGDVAWSMDDFATAISDTMGTPVTVAELDPDGHRAALVESGADEGTAGFLVAVDGAIRTGELGGTPGHLSGLIGRPTTPLADTLRGAAARA